MGLLDASWGGLGPLGRLLGPSWGQLGTVLGLLDASWGCLGAILGLSWASWTPRGADLRPSWGRLGVLGRLMGSPWGHLWAALGLFSNNNKTEIKGWEGSDRNKSQQNQTNPNTTNRIETKRKGINVAINTSSLRDQGNTRKRIEIGTGRFETNRIEPSMLNTRARDVLNTMTTGPMTMTLADHLPSP